MTTPYYEVKYDCPTDLTKEYYEDILRQSKVITLWWDDEPCGDCAFVYFPEENCITPRHMTRGLYGEESRVFGLYDPDTFYELLIHASSVKFDFDEVKPEGVEYTTKFLLNYTVIINDLERAGIVKTMRTTTWTAKDHRKFWIVNTETKDDARDVDCLGTSLFENLTIEVVNLWKNLKEENHVV